MKGKVRRETKEGKGNYLADGSEEVKKRNAEGQTASVICSIFVFLFWKEGTSINKTIIKMDESGGTKRNIRREYVKSR